MNAKTLLVISLALNATLAGTLAYLFRQIPEVDYLPAIESLAANPSPGVAMGATSQTALSLRFGPVREVLLPHLGEGKRPELLDLETGRRLREPEFESFGNNARANIAWIKMNGLDISGLVFDQTNGACLAYYLAAIPVERRLWEEALPTDILGHSGLAQVRDPKRTFLSPQRDHTDTFLFRTHEGTAGILRVVGVTPDRRNVTIRYKLVQAQ